VLLHLLDAGRRMGVEFVSSAHECTGVIAAAYYGYFKGCPGLAISVQGTGAGNMASGALIARFERKPVVCVCECPAIDDFGEWGQQWDHPGLFNSVAKACLRTSEHNTAQSAYDAFRLAAMPRPGPVLLELPRDLEKTEGSSDLTTTADPVLDDPDPAELDALCEMVTAFRKPVIIAGDDVRQQGCVPQLLALAESLQAAVLLTMDGRGVFPETHNRFGCVHIGTAPQHTLYRSFLEEADGVLVVGADGRMREARWDIDVPVCELITQPEFPTLSDTPVLRVNGRLSPGFERLKHLTNPDGFPVSRIAEMRALDQGRFERPPGAQLAAPDIIAITREQMPEDTLMFAETGIIQTMLERLWPVTVPDTCFASTVGRTMGLAIPAMLGAKLALPDRPVVTFTTDGSALMRLGELETYARTGASAPIIVMNDGALGTIRAQQKFKGIPDYGLELRLVDFALAARAAGLNGIIVETPEAFAKALQAAMTADTATVIDARVDPQAYRDSFMITTGSIP
jgi:acetolactate synthase-1/2/3 large subunit